MQDNGRALGRTVKKHEPTPRTIDTGLDITLDTAELYHHNQYWTAPFQAHMCATKVYPSRSAIGLERILFRVGVVPSPEPSPEALERPEGIGDQVLAEQYSCEPCKQGGVVRMRRCRDQPSKPIRLNVEHLNSKSGSISRRNESNVQPPYKAEKKAQARGPRPVTIRQHAGSLREC